MNSSDENPGNPERSEATIASSLEHLVAGSQGILTKRIDLAMLEAREALSNAIQGVVLLGVVVLLAVTAWLTTVAVAILWATPEASWVARGAVFSLVNTATVAVLVAFAARRNRASIDTVAPAVDAEPPEDRSRDLTESSLPNDGLRQPERA